MRLQPDAVAFKGQKHVLVLTCRDLLQTARESNAALLETTFFAALKAAVNYNFHVLTLCVSRANLLMVIVFGIHQKPAFLPTAKHVYGPATKSHFQTQSR